MSVSSPPESTAELPVFAEQRPESIAERPGAGSRLNPSVRPAMHDESGNRSFLLTWILSLFLGYLGADRFYTGRYFTGALKLLSLGGLGVWWAIDLVIVMVGGLRYDDRPLTGYAEGKEVAWIATGFLIIVGYSLQLDAVIADFLTRLF